MIFSRRKRKQVPYEKVEDWRNEILNNLGLTGDMGNDMVREAVRKILMASARLLEDIDRSEAGMRPKKRRRQ